MCRGASCDRTDTDSVARVAVAVAEALYRTARAPAHAPRLPSSGQRVRSALTGTSTTGADTRAGTAPIPVE